MKQLLSDLRKKGRVVVRRPKDIPSEGSEPAEKAFKMTTKKKQKKTLQSCVYATSAMGRTIVQKTFYPLLNNT